MKVVQRRDPAGRIIELLQRVADLERRLNQPTTAALAQPTGRARSAAVFVAAIDSTVAEKASADYVCDGNADEVEIKAAMVDATAIFSGKVVLLSGNFTCSTDAVITVYQGCHLQGQGADATTIKLAGAGSYVTVSGGADYATLSDLSVKAFVGTPPDVLVYGYNRSMIERVYAAGSSGFANEAFEIGHESIVTACHAQGIDYGFLIYANAVLVACRAGDSGVVGISSASGGTRVIGCFVIGTVGTKADIGISVAGGASQVVGNRVLQTGAEGIYVFDHDSQVHDNKVVRCGQKTDNTYSGIRIDGFDNSIQGNMVRHDGATNRTDYGIKNVGATNIVANNDLKNSGRTGSFNDPGVAVTLGGNRL